MTRAVWAALAAMAVAAPTSPFRSSRPIEAAAGWARLELPDEVLDACRPGLPDVRIRDGAGRDVPFAFEQEVGPSARRFDVANLESVEKTETSGWIDRGPSPGFADAVTFEIPGDDFLKPVVLQSSDDRSAWKDIAKGSLFVTGEVRMLTLRFPESDRRYLRFRLDDRNGQPVRVAVLTVRARGGDAASPPRERPVAMSRLPSETQSIDLHAAVLPAANLRVTALRFQTRDLAFSRPVRVYERVRFRDEVFRCLAAGGTLTRSPGNLEPIDLPLAGAAGRNLEIEIDDGDSPPLAELRVAALVRSRTLRFLAPEGSGLTLLYGSSSARAPQFDLGRALQAAASAPPPEATLGEERTEAAAVAPVSAPPRALLPDAGKWTSRRPIALPPGASVAYLDLVDLPAGLPGMRIVDEENRQVAYLVERGSHLHRRPVHGEPSTAGSRTVLRFDGVENLSSAEGIELSATAPDYFSREVTVREEQRDARGVSGTAVLGTARWVRQPGERPPILSVPIRRPTQRRGALLVEIENGDNVPLRVADAWLTTAAVRIDFVANPSERLFLLSGNPEAGTPSYDLAMLADLVLAAPAGPARLGAPAESARHSRIPRWFPAAAVIAAVLLLFQLSRLLKQSSDS